MLTLYLAGRRPPFVFQRAAPRPSALGQIVKLADPHSGQERRDFRAAVDLRRAGRVPRVADGDRTVRQCRHLDAVPAWVAPLALSPGHLELVGGHSVAGRHLFRLLVTVGTCATSDATEITSPIAQCVCTLQMHCSNLAGA